MSKAEYHFIIPKEHITFLTNLLLRHIVGDTKNSNGTPLKHSSKEASKMVKEYIENEGFHVLPANNSFHGLHALLEPIMKVGSDDQFEKLYTSTYRIKDFFNFITLHFFGENIVDWLEDNTINDKKRKDIFSELYFRKLYRTFSETESTENQILFDLKNNNNIADSDLDWFLGVIPELFLNSSIRYDDEKTYFGFYNRNSQYVSNPVRFNGNQKLYKNPNKNTRKILSTINEPFSIKDEIKGLFMIHALSPIDDNLFLLCEMGRFARIAHGLKTIRKDLPVEIVCVNENWSKLNNTIKELEERTNIDYLKNIRQRELIYSRILKTLGNKKKYKFTSLDNVNDISVDTGFNGFSSIKEEVDAYLEFSKSPELIKSIKTAFLTKVVKGLKTSTNFIETIKKKFIRGTNSIDKDTLQYVIFQRHLQHKYKNYLKVGIFREFDFDDTFNQLNSDNNLAHEDYEFYGLYFKDYMVKVPNGSSLVKLKTHPYFFPSGNYYKEIKAKHLEKGLDLENSKFADGKTKKSQDILFKNLMKELSSNIILFSDFDDYSKINEIVSRYSMKQLSTIMCDLLTFIFYFFDKGDATEIIRHADMGKEFYNVWKKSYSQKDKNKRENIYQNHFDNFLAFSYNTSNPPFYFYPYIFAFDDLKMQESHYQAKYSRLIHRTLEKINNLYENI